MTFLISAATVPITSVPDDRHFDFSLKRRLPRSSRPIRPSLSTPALKSGTHTYGLERFWNSCHRRSEKGLEVSLLAWLDIPAPAPMASVSQTPPSDKTAEPQGTRIDAYLEQLRTITSSIYAMIADGYYSKRKFLDGVRALGLQQMGKLHANLRYLYQGAGRPGPGRPKTYDGKVQWDESRFERVHSEDDGIVPIIKSSTTCIFGATCVSCLWWIPALSGERCCSAPIPTWMRRRFIVGTKHEIESFRDAKQFTSLSACRRSKPSCMFTSMPA